MSDTESDSSVASSSSTYESDSDTSSMDCNTSEESGPVPMIPMYDGAQLTILDSYWKVTSAVTLCDEASVCKFIMVPVATQLKRRLEDPQTWVQLQKRFNRTTDGGIHDIYDGAEYMKHACRGGFLSVEHPANVSLTINTDGVQLFQSSDVHFWPVWLVINELPPSLRFARHNILLAGLWYDTDDQPTMTTYLRPLMDSMNSLCEHGIAVQTPVGSLTCKAMLLVASTDLPAKAQLLNMKHHNGKCACPHCEAVGVPREGCPMQRNWPHQSARAPLQMGLSICIPVAAHGLLIINKHSHTCNTDICIVLSTCKHSSPCRHPPSTIWWGCSFHVHSDSFSR